MGDFRNWHVNVPELYADISHMQTLELPPWGGHGLDRVVWICVLVRPNEANDDILYI